MSNIKKQQERDRNISNYLEQFKAATTDTLAILFFPNLLAAQKRLKKLATEYKAINRHRDHISQQYYYFIDKKPVQLKHRLLLTDFHRELIKLGVRIVKFDNEFTKFESVRPDGFIALELPGGAKGLYFIETERSNRPDIEKYEKLHRLEEWKKVFPVFPTIIWITNKKIPKSELKIIHLRENLSDIKNLIKGD